MKSMLSFGKKKVVMTGAGRARKIKLFDFTTVAAGHLSESLSSAEINRGALFSGLNADQNRAVRKWVNRSYTYSPERGVMPDRVFPTIDEVLHRFYVEAQSPAGNITANHEVDTADDEPIDGALQMSCEAVTDWYVEKYCRDNHLKY